MSLPLLLISFIRRLCLDVERKKETLTCVFPSHAIRFIVVGVHCERIQKKLVTQNIYLISSWLKPISTSLIAS